MKNKSRLLIILTLLLTFLACSKDEDLTNTQMLSTEGGKEWQTLKLVKDTVDITENINPCTKDNIHKFYIDRTYELLEGDTACNPDDTLSVMGSWSMNDVQTILEIIIGNDTSEYIIRELENGKLGLIYMEQESGHQYTWSLKPR